MQRNKYCKQIFNIMVTYGQQMYILNYLAKNRYNATLEKVWGDPRDPECKLLLKKVDGTVIIKTVNQIRQENHRSASENHSLLTLAKTAEESPWPENKSLKPLLAEGEAEEIEQAIARAKEKYLVEPLKPKKKSFFSKIKDRFRPKPK